MTENEREKQLEENRAKRERLLDSLERLMAEDEAETSAILGELLDFKAFCKREGTQGTHKSNPEVFRRWAEYIRDFAEEHGVELYLDFTPPEPDPWDRMGVDELSFKIDVVIGRHDLGDRRIYHGLIANKRLDLDIDLISGPLGIDGREALQLWREIDGSEPTIP